MRFSSEVGAVNTSILYYVPFYREREYCRNAGRPHKMHWHTTCSLLIENPIVKQLVTSCESWVSRVQNCQTTHGLRSCISIRQDLGIREDSWVGKKLHKRKTSDPQKRNFILGPYKQKIWVTDSTVGVCSDVRLQGD